MRERENEGEERITRAGWDAWSGVPRGHEWKVEVTRVEAVVCWSGDDHLVAITAVWAAGQMSAKSATDTSIILNGAFCQRNYITKSWSLACVRRSELRAVRLGPVRLQEGGRPWRKNLLAPP